MDSFEAAQEATQEIGLAGAGDDAVAGGHLRAGLVHVEHLRALPLPVRHHRGGGGAGLAAGLLHPDADDERPHAARRGRRLRSRWPRGPRQQARPPARGRASMAGSTAATSGCCAFTMAHRRAAALICLGVMLASIPLFKLVKVEYIPSDVDESEFEVNVTRARGDEPRRRSTRPCAPIEAEIRQVHGVRSVLATAGGGFLGGVNQGNVFVRIAPQRGAQVLDLRASSSGLVHLDPGAAFRGNYSQQDVMAGGPRAASRSSRDLRCAVRNLPSFNIGGGNFDIDFALRGPDLQALAALRRAAAREVQGARRHRRRRHHAQARQARAAGRGRPRPRRRPGRRHVRRRRAPCS